MFQPLFISLPRAVDMMYKHSNLWRYEILIILKCVSYIYCFVLAGIFRGGHEIMVRSKLALADGVTMQLTVRSTLEAVADLVTSAIG